MTATNSLSDPSSSIRAPEEHSHAAADQTGQAADQEEVHEVADASRPSNDVTAVQREGEPEASKVQESTEAVAPATTAASGGEDNAAVQASTTSEMPTTTAETSARALRKQPEALGPASDTAIATPASSPSTGPTLNISLMLTTGARHPYRVDERYLRNRNVTSAADAEGRFDPRELSGYQLKELIWTDWRAEWEPRPASPSSIRLILLGRMLDDKAALKDYPFNLANVNVVHMTVKPADLLEDDETAAGKAGKSSILRVRDGEDRGAGCRCVIL